MSREFIEEADRELTETDEEPMSLEEYVDQILAQPQLASHASKYLLEAIDGTVVAASAAPGDIEFVQGREFELDADYSLDLLRMAADTTISRVQRAGSEVVRQSETPKLGGLVYPLMQTLDIDALDADIAYGGIDQRGIYMLSRELFAGRDKERSVCSRRCCQASLAGR